uniref:Uncharacterized protein n=1 Tax=Cyclopterus lumpus TaxID=8103 RepID=A0A8C2ZGV3_CYCLU
MRLPETRRRKDSSGSSPRLHCRCCLRARRLQTNPPEGNTQTTGYHRHPIMMQRGFRVRRATLTWDCVLAPKAFGDFLNIPLNTPPASWRRKKVTLKVFLLSLLPESSPAADKSS